MTVFGLLLLCRHSKQLCHFLGKKNPRHSSPGNSHRRGSGGGGRGSCPPDDDDVIIRRYNNTCKI